MSHHIMGCDGDASTAKLETFAAKARRPCPRSKHIFWDVKV